MNNLAVVVLVIVGRSATVVLAPAVVHRDCGRLSVVSRACLLGAERIDSSRINPFKHWEMRTAGRSRVGSIPRDVR